MNNTGKILLTSILFFISLCLWATEYDIDTSFIQQNLRKIPSNAKKSPYQLGSYFLSEYKDEPSRAYAISYWIADNIDYDFEGSIIRRPEESSVDLVFKTKKALCGEFANLFKAMCDSAKLDAVVLDGYKRGFDFLPNDTLFRAEHSWAAVKINNQWQLVDLTYASGTVVSQEEIPETNDSILYSLPISAKSKYVKRINSDWIFADPAMVIINHFPLIEDFQLLEYPVTFDEFRQGDGAVRKHVEQNNDTIANSDELIAFSKLSQVDRLYFMGNTGIKLNKFDNRVKAFSYISAVNKSIEKLFNPERTLLKASKIEFKKLKKRLYTADSLLKLSLRDNELEYRQLQKRSENWKMSLKIYNKLHRDDLRNRITANNNDLKIIDNMYQKGVNLTQHLTESKAQFFDKSIDGIKRPKIKDPAMEKQAEIMMRQQDSIRKLSLSILFQIENVIRAYNQDKVIAICKEEKKALDIYESSIQTMQEIAKNNRINLYMVHIPTTNVDKEWLKDRNMDAHKINKDNIDGLLVNLAANQQKLSDLIRVYTGYLKERLTLLKMAKKSSMVNHQEDSLYQAAISNFSDNLLSYHYELKTYTITKELLKDNLENENKKMTELSEKLQKESDVENVRHKSYMEYRKQIKDAENLRTKLATKSVIKLNTLIDKSLILAK